MLVNSVQLTMSHTGLGDLNEYALMVLFGNAHSFHLVKGLKNTPSEILSMNGTRLYPAYFWTHLSVPLPKLLHSYKLWQVVDIGVDVKRFGDTLLQSEYALAPKGELPQETEEWSKESYPVMQGNNLIVAEELNSATAKRAVINPDPEKISALPKVTQSPKGIAQSRNMRAEGVKRMIEAIQFKNRLPYVYKILDGRDCTHGHAMIFAKFADIMDIAEKDFLANQLVPGLSTSLLSHLCIVDREIYYYGNCYSGETLEIYVSGSIEMNDNDDLIDSVDYIPAAFASLGFEVYAANTKTLLACSITKKVFAIPMQEQEQINDLRRIVSNLDEY